MAVGLSFDISKFDVVKEKLNQIAISQMKVLNNTDNKKLLH